MLTCRCPRHDVHYTETRDCGAHQSALVDYDAIRITWDKCGSTKQLVHKQADSKAWYTAHKTDIQVERQRTTITRPS